MSKLEQLLTLQEIDKDLYSSVSLYKPFGARGVFGGQVVGLALSAALKTVDERFVVHSLHSYFLLPGDNSRPIIYLVDRVRDGKTYCSRSITAKQNGRTVSLVCPEESVLSYQIQMPIVPGPEGLTSQEDKLRALLNSTDPSIEKYREAIKLRLSRPVILEMRYLNPKYLYDKIEAKQMIWIKAKDKLPDAMAFHHCVVAYISDVELLNTALIPHGLAGWGSHRRLTMLASLDHAIWFYSEYRADEWLLYEMESARTGNGRAFTSGRIWTQDGRLVASTAQEGVVRYSVQKEKL